MKEMGAVVAYSNEKGVLIILKTCEGFEKLLTPEGERAFKDFTERLLNGIKNPLEVLDRYAEVKKLFKELKSKLGIQKAGLYIYDIENSYPLSEEEGIERLVDLIESETIWEKPVLAYSKCLEEAPIVKIYDLDKKEVLEAATA